METKRRRSRRAPPLPQLGTALVTGLLALPFFQAAPLVAQDPPPISVAVADEVTRQLIPSATVTLLASGLEAQGGGDGSFSFPETPLGPVSLRIEAPGYLTVVQDVEVVAGQALIVEVLMPRAVGEASLRFRVTDAISNLPIPGARVGFPELDLFALSDTDGLAALTTIPAGTYVFEITMDGYATAQSLVEFSPGAVAEGEVALGTQPIEIDGITVTATSREGWNAYLDRRGFYQRQISGLGHYLDWIDIAEAHAIFTTDLFRSVPGLEVRWGNVGWGDDGVPSGSPNGVSVHNRRLAFAGFDNPNGCPMQVFLDGVPWPGGDINALPPDFIGGIEIYQGDSEIPAQFNFGPDSGCGAIVIWSR
jgi:hypothetical protein